MLLRHEMLQALGGQDAKQDKSAGRKQASLFVGRASREGLLNADQFWMKASAHDGILWENPGSGEIGRLWRFVKFGLCSGCVMCLHRMLHCLEFAMTE